MPELATTRPGAPVDAERISGAAAGRVSRRRRRARRHGVDRLRRARRRSHRRSSCDAREATLQFDDPVNIQYTSGTTGSPKGATLSHHNILNNGFFVGDAAPLHRSGSHLRAGALLPLLRLRARQPGRAHARLPPIVIPGEAFDAEATLRAIEAHGCTSIYGVPTMFIAQLDHPRFGSFRLDSLRTGIMAGAPCPIDVMRQVIDRMHVPEVTICYGMTETSPVSFQSEVDDPDRPARVDGRPRAASPRMQDRRSGDRRDRAARDRRRTVHARLLRDARLLERS